MHASHASRVLSINNKVISCTNEIQKLVQSRSFWSIICTVKGNCSHIWVVLSTNATSGNRHEQTTPLLKGNLEYFIIIIIITAKSTAHIVDIQCELFCCSHDSVYQDLLLQIQKYSPAPRMTQYLVVMRLKETKLNSLRKCSLKKLKESKGLLKLSRSAIP